MPKAGIKPWLWFGVIMISIEHVCCRSDDYTNEQGFWSWLWYGHIRPPQRNAYHNHKNLRLLPVLNRLYEQMRHYNEESHIRVIDMLYYRFMYEESPHYELGYLFGEVMERYRKIIVAAKIIQKRKQESYFAILQRTYFFQMWFIEIYHLVNMMHEIYPKWKSNPEFISLKADEVVDLGNLYDTHRQIELQKKRELKKREKKKKRQSQLEHVLSVGKVHVAPPGARPNPYNNRFPLDYGWEPEHFDEFYGEF